MKTIKQTISDVFLGQNDSSDNATHVFDEIAEGINVISGEHCVSRQSIEELRDLVLVGEIKTSDEFSDVMLKVNESLGRVISFENGAANLIAEDSSYERANLPDFLHKILLGPYSSKRKSIPGDYKAMLSVLTNYAYPNMVLRGAKAIIKKSFDVCEEKFTSKDFDIGTINFLLSRINNYDNEISKAQMLVGSPSFYTPLSAGRHNVYDTAPQGFDLDMFIEASDALVSILKKDILSYYENISISLPLFTSQGIMLKGKQESKKERTISKAMHALVASKCRDMKELASCMEEIGKEFSDRGYTNPWMTFVMGVRKQHWKKEELVTNGNKVVAYTKGIQGRIRGIFPPQEAYKIKFKRKADAVKKTLFERTFCCKVDPEHIAKVINKVESNLISANLFSYDYDLNDLEEIIKKREIHDIRSYCAYDLSAFDTSQHSGLTGVYDYFMSSVFGEASDEIRFSDFALLGHIFPRKEGLRLMHINGNSTMSGQPDVTVKNNIIHILCMAVAFNKLRLYLLDDKERAREFANEGLLRLNGIRDILEEILFSKRGLITTLIHGDDTAIYFSDNRELYEMYKTYFNLSGVTMDFERGFTYLKKEGVHFDTHNHLISKSCADDVAANIFVGPNRKLQPVPTSVLRNRFGEYPSDGLYTSIAGALDIVILLLGHPLVGFDAFRAVILELFFLNSLAKREVKDDELSFSKDIFTLIAWVLEYFEASESKNETTYLKKHHAIVKLARDISLKLSIIIAEDVDDTIADAIKMRTLLDSIFFKHGQIGTRNSSNISLTLLSTSDTDDDHNDFDDHELSSLYGNLFYNPDKVAESLGLSALSLNESVDLCKKIQGILLDSDGDWTEVYNQLPELGSLDVSDLS